MHAKTISIFFLSCFWLQSAAADDWRQWRGPSGNGKAAPDEAPPLRWSSDSSIVWKTALPGRGHSSPTVVGNRIFLTTADGKGQTQSVLCVDRNNGKRMWDRTLHKGGWVQQIHKKNTHASPTIASDGSGLFVLFHNENRIILTRLDLDGNQLWQQVAGDFRPYYPFGFASSPTLSGKQVIVAAESEKHGFLRSYDRTTGEPLWKTERNSTSYSSPIVARVAGREQLLLSGDSSISGFDPQNGKRLWTSPANWKVSCGTLVWSKDKVFASGGFPRGQTLCVKADDSGQLVWQNRVKCYEQSLLFHEGYLYGISDSGIGYCWDGETGKEMWKTRMEGPVSSSPVLAGGNIYYTSERGTTYVFRANPNAYEELARNRLGDSAFATPAFCGNRIYARVGFDEGKQRQEYLVCIGR
ncbi:MAG: PQQ-binding-like beta-propeller repeat protein [Planctomycetota bacterium]|nr:PQQ-binding-like beta-propeller repeat protein [Planctomycetota bacterium]